MTYGQGSVYQRSTDGRWIGALSVPSQRGSKRMRKMFSGKTQAEAEAKLAAYRDAMPAREFKGRVEWLAEAQEKGTHTEREWYAKVRRLGSRCIYCGASPRPYGVGKDHVIPLSRGGSDGIENVVPACGPCNNSKRASLLSEWLDYMVKGRKMKRGEAKAIRERVSEATSEGTA